MTSYSKIDEYVSIDESIVWIVDGEEYPQDDNLREYKSNK